MTEFNSNLNNLFQNFKNQKLNKGASQTEKKI